MVLIEKPGNRSLSRYHLKLILLAIAFLAVVLCLNLESNGERREKLRSNKPMLKLQKDSSPEELEDQRAALNAARVREVRHSLATGRNKIPGPIATSSPLRKCQHVFLDFGSNIGDALHKVIDSFLPAIEERQYVLNTTTGELGPEYYGTPRQYWTLPEWVKEQITSYNTQSTRDPVYPEDYCFYGVEGNPYFTPMLQQQEISMLNMSPRPIRHLHFLTEHVGSAADGPQTLFLDTVNAKNHYWGSSILDSHVDVKKSGEKTGVQVMGITLTTLLEKTVAPGGHVMMKIDIEGAEYQMLEEAVKSDIFCKLIKEMGVRVDVLMEFHHDSTIGSEEPRKRWEEVVKGEEAILKCGVNYKVLSSWIPIW